LNHAHFKNNKAYVVYCVLKQCINTSRSNELETPIKRADCIMSQRALSFLPAGVWTGYRLFEEHGRRTWCESHLSV